jgi:hypothetical protein
MACAGNAESAVLQYVEERGTVTMEDVIRHLHHLTFNQVFYAVDQLSREGKIYLARPTSSGYAISSHVYSLRPMVSHKGESNHGT